MSNHKPALSTEYKPARVSVFWLVVAAIAFMLMMGIVVLIIVYGGGG